MSEYYACYFRYIAGSGSLFSDERDFRVVGRKPTEDEMKVIDLLWDSLEEIEHEEETVSCREIWRSGEAYEVEVEKVFLAPVKFWVIEKHSRWQSPQEYSDVYYRVHESKGPFRDKQEALITVVREGRRLRR